MLARLPAVAAVLIAFGALSGVDRGTPALLQEAVRWREIAWPFPRDGWPAGRAFRCEDAACGGRVELYVRPKLGFCNCDRGVADDDEVDRVTDLDLVSERFAPLAPGEPIRIGELVGRSRSYLLNTPDGPRQARGIAVSRGCDVFVAVVQGSGEAAEMQREALGFLQSPAMRQWTIAALEGR